MVDVSFWEVGSAYWISALSSKAPILKPALWAIFSLRQMTAFLQVASQLLRHAQISEVWRLQTESGCRDFRTGRSRPVTELCELNVGYVATISAIAATAPDQQVHRSAFQLVFDDGRLKKHPLGWVRFHGHMT